MTLPRSETPLRRSAVGSYRDGAAERGREERMRDSVVSNITTLNANDDESERREARRRTLIQMQHRSSVGPGESIEENETIRNCLEIFNGNKLSKDNAWNLSLIDTLSSLLERHHKTLSNFKMAGSSLEASSKVYGLRVDSIYLDAMRMSAGLSAKTLTQKQINAAEQDETMTGPGDGSGEHGDTEGHQAEGNAPAKPKKRARKAVSTVTKNKETLNARLDTAPLQDPVFGKLNSTVGSINASNRLMHNILPTRDSELRLRTTYKYWDAQDLEEDLPEYDELVKSERLNLQGGSQDLVMSADWLQKLLPRIVHMKLRPLHTGYHITDAPNPSDKIAQSPVDDDDETDDRRDDCGFYENPKDLSMVFDINAECEPLPELDPAPNTMLDVVDFNDLDELTQEEQTVLNRCRNLHKKSVLIDDLRPVDGSSKLEYSYRPMDQISQFWAGPSHWKFKRNRPRSTFGQLNGQSGVSNIARASNQRIRLAQARRTKSIQYGHSTESSFQTLDAQTKLRKVNYQKKWDARRLTLPLKFSFLPDYFYQYELAPSEKLSRRFGQPDIVEEEIDLDEALDQDDNDVELFDNDHFMADTPQSPTSMQVGGLQAGDLAGGVRAEHSPMEISLSGTQMGEPHASICNDTVLEIATDFEGAPTQVTKVVVPFAKRAKVIDMKNLKRSCKSLIQKQLLEKSNLLEDTMPSHPGHKTEEYDKGIASFRDIYDKLPYLLTAKMADSLSEPVALYAVLHLANDFRLRLIPQENLEDFQIRQLAEKSHSGEP
ncbi:condensin complex subunit 2 [Drosophila tropicalis]|uniref:condensin complex subunit 2 n=1 Tax=Drosophila tropicalis TaxID=46794 RepID=UPI0035AC021D